MDKTSTIVQFRAMVENLPSSKKNLDVAKNLVNFALESRNIIGITDPEFLRITNAIYEAITFFVNEDKIREATVLADSYVDLLEEINNPSETINRTKEISKVFFSKKDTAYHIYCEDLLNRVISILDDDSRLNELGLLFIDIAENLQKLKIHEMAINYYERGITYLIDADNKDLVLNEIHKLLEIARVLSLKNNEYSSQYMDLVNSLVADANIDLKKDTNTQLAYQSYSDHLLKSSRDVVESRANKSGRLAKKKREFFKRKQ